MNCGGLGALWRVGCIEGDWVNCGGSGELWRVGCIVEGWVH